MDVSSDPKINDDDFVIIPTMQEAFNNYFEIPSSIYFLDNLHLPLYFDLQERGAFYLCGACYKFVLFKDYDTPYYHIKAHDQTNRLFLIGIYDLKRQIIYAKVVPVNLAPVNDKQYYMTYAFVEIYNPQNKKWISPCTYGKSLRMLLPLKRKSYRLKNEKAFKPLPHKFRIWRKYFSVVYEWNIILIKKHKLLLILKHAKRRFRREAQKQN